MKKGICVFLFAVLLLLGGCIKNVSPDSELLPESPPEPATELDLSGSADFSPKDLSALPLEKLDMHGMGLDDLGFLADCTGLKWLDLRGNNLRPEDFDRLHAALPDCEILWDVPIGSEKYDSGSEELVLPAGAPEKELSRLAYLENLKTADVTALDCWDTLHALRQVFPDVDFRWQAEICGVTVTGEDSVLDLTGCETVTPEDLAPVESFENITAVDLRSREYSMEEMDALCAVCPDKPLLFNFTFADTEIDGGATLLDLNNRKIGSADALRACLRHMPLLEQAEVCDCGLGNEELAAVRADFPQLKLVWMLHMRQYSLRTDAVAFSTLVGLDDYTVLSSRDITVLKYCTDLEALDLGHHHIRDISVLDYLPKLRILILVDNELSDLTPIAQLKELRYLELFVNYRVRDISPLASLENLVDLNLSFMPYIEDYSPLYGLEHLERLWLNGNEYSKSELEEIRSHFPESCEICAKDGIGSTDGGWRKHDRHFMQRAMFRQNYIDPWFYENP